MWSRHWTGVIATDPPNQQNYRKRSRVASHYVIDYFQDWCNYCCARPDRMKGSWDHWRWYRVQPEEASPILPQMVRTFIHHHLGTTTTSGQDLEGRTLRAEPWRQVLGGGNPALSNWCWCRKRGTMRERNSRRDFLQIVILVSKEKWYWAGLEKQARLKWLFGTMPSTPYQR